MPEASAHSARAQSAASARPVRDAADAYVRRLAGLDPLVATRLGLPVRQDELPDLSPVGQQARDDLARGTLARLDEVLGTAGSLGGQLDGDERRCARLLRERLEADLALSEAGEHLRAVSNVFGPPHDVRGIFLLMPTTTEDDWAVIARRMSRVPGAFAGYRESLRAGSLRGLFAPPRLVRTVTSQYSDWLAAGDGMGWFAEFAGGANVPSTLRSDLDTAATAANRAVAELRDWMSEEYLPRADGTPDGVGGKRYRVGARKWIGAAIDPRAEYERGWAQYRELDDELRAEARRVLVGAAPLEAMRHLDEHSPAVVGVEAVRQRLQQMLDEAVANLDGTHFDLADPIKVVEARIAPAGSAAAPYYTAPSNDFSRPGRTWLPTLGKTEFPLWNLISTWYHEGVPGHHLQIAQWRYLAEQLSLFQTSVGGVSACSEGWALYAERLMDELGYLEQPGARLGYLAGQLMRAMRVVVDIGMHLRLPAPADSPTGPGETWTPELAELFFSAHSDRSPDFVRSEIVRYLSAPGQAISYKLGERAWLAGREAARAARGARFDLKSWHMAALSLGSVGLEDLIDELARL